MAAQYGLVDGPPLFTSETFKTCHKLFYGTLLDLDVLQHSTRCPTKPLMQPGRITGFKPKMDVCGSSPARAKRGRRSIGKGDNAQTRESEPSDEIRAMLWKVEDYQHFWEIRQYETSAYRGHWCHIHVEGVDSDSEEDLIPKDGAAFVWAKDPQSPGLKEGVFDLQKLQKTHKASISIRVKYMSCTGRSNGMKVDRRDS
ncbi:hypothetical protein F4824DRAFT_510341 [Ustulina deusta]|nr:hypothetical protein F4824DRAFT_510341 [Ustulina deusta]